MHATSVKFPVMFSSNWFVPFEDKDKDLRLEDKDKDKDLKSDDK